MGGCLGTKSIDPVKIGLERLLFVICLGDLTVSIYLHQNINPG